MTRRHALAALGAAPLAQALVKPRIDLWHGKRQRFGHLGLPQRWINILGAVSPAEHIAQLDYSLNGLDFLPLSKGPDLYRLASAGDFNIEIDHADLEDGENRVVIRSKDRDGVTSEETIVVDYTPGVVWRLPYEVDFAKVKDLQDVCQVVDGRWRLEKDGVRTADPYYDRVLAFGDMNWTNYALTAEVIFHDFPGPTPGGGPGFGVNHAGIGLRWRGHDDDGRQPHVAWYPLGAATEFTLQKDLSKCKWRIIPGPPQKTVYADEPYAIELGKKYWIKGEVRTMPDGRNRYRNKIWSPDRNELDFWAVERFEKPSRDFSSGSALLVAHRSDVTFGRVKIEAV